MERRVVTVFVLVESEHESGVAVVVVGKDPVVDVPRDLNRNSLHLDLLVPTELPFQVLHLENLNAVDGETEPAVVVVPAIDLDVPAFTRDCGFGGVNFVGNYLLPLQDQGLGVLGVEGFGAGIGLLHQIADEENDLSVVEESEVESGDGFRGGAEAGAGEVPEEAEGRGEDFGAGFLPEGDGVQAEESAGERIPVVGVELDGAGPEGSEPGQGEGRHGGFVNGGRQIGVGAAGGHCRRRRRNRGRGAAEAGGVRGGPGRHCSGLRLSAQSYCILFLSLYFSLFIYIYI